MLDRHGLKIKGIRKAASDTFDLENSNRGWNEIIYNTRTGEVRVEFRTSISWNTADDPDDIFVGKTCFKMTMQNIADAIADAIDSSR